MPLPPNRLDDLRDIARALGQRPPPSPEPGGPRGWAVVGMIVALFALGWITARTCGFRGCAEAPQDIAVRVARVLATPVGAPEETSTPVVDAPNAIGALLDRERRVALPVAAPTVAWSPVSPPTPVAHTRARRGGRLPAPPARAPSAPLARARSPLPRVLPTPMPPRAVAADVSGRWLVTNTIADTSYAAFRGLRIRFRVELAQQGTRITGKGLKFTVSDRPVPPAQRTTLDLEGTIRGRDVVVHFREHGARRRSRGTFRWRLSADGRNLQGRFESTAAATGGVSSARRDG